LFLIPGDSPIGLRLPLASLPWVDPRHAPEMHYHDPMAEPEMLPTRQDPREQGDPMAAPAPAPSPRPAMGSASMTSRVPGKGESADGVVRTAMAVQPREGRLH